MPPSLCAPMGQAVTGRTQRTEDSMHTLNQVTNALKHKTRYAFKHKSECMSIIMFFYDFTGTRRSTRATKGNYGLKVEHVTVL